MPTAKDLLLVQLAQSFEGRKDMPLLATLDGITQEEASWQPTPMSPSVEQLARHIAWSAAVYCREAFGVPMPVDDPAVSPEGDTEGIPWEFPCGSGYGLKSHPGIGGAVELLKRAHGVMLECLRQLPEGALDEPLSTRHGKSAAHFFWIMTMHNLYHAGQIRTRRTLRAGRV